MSFFDDIFSLVWDISELFHEAYLEVDSWYSPFNYLATPLYWIYRRTGSLLTPISQVSDWAYDINQSIASLPSMGTIWSTFKDWFNWAEWSWQWVQDSWLIIPGMIDDWWNSTMVEVQGWIDESSQYFTGIVNTLLAKVSQVELSISELLGRLPVLDELVSWWDNWQGNVHTYIDTWWTSTMGEVQGLINTAFIDRESWWTGWIDVKNEVIEFITNPLDFLLDRFTDWFLGPEE